MLRNAEKHSTRSVSVNSRMVEVCAPAALNEGYTFWATVENSSFPVIVPAGGVKTGQKWLMPLFEDSIVQRDGQWKDGIFSCFRFGLCHPHLCNAWLCPQIILGQILTRMRMTWLANSDISKSTCQTAIPKIMLCVLFVSLYEAFMGPPLVEDTSVTNGKLELYQNGYPFWHQVFYIAISLPMTIYGLILVVKLRSAIRAKYGIPTGFLGKMEDFCCVCFCNCCTVSQMARQTADYEDEPASCCSPNGMIREHSSLVQDV